MTGPDDDLVERIRSLDEATAVEAAQLLGVALGVERREADDLELFQRPLEHRDDIADLCRITLVAGAADPEIRELVEESLAGAGRKHLVLGGAELVALAAIALGALQVCLSRGRVETEEIIETRTNSDGSAETVIRRKIRYGVSAKLAKVLGSLAGPR